MPSSKGVNNNRLVCYNGTSIHSADEGEVVTERYSTVTRSMTLENYSPNIAGILLEQPSNERVIYNSSPFVSTISPNKLGREIKQKNCDDTVTNKLVMSKILGTTQERECQVDWNKHWSVGEIMGVEVITQLHHENLWWGAYCDFNWKETCICK